MVATSVSKIEGFDEVQKMLKEYREGGALELKQYREIGTIEECKKARKSQIAQKPITTPNCGDCEKESCNDCLSDNYGFSVTLCPNCKEVVENRNNGDVSTYNFCPNCGQALDWNKE